MSDGDRARNTTRKNSLILFLNRPNDQLADLEAFVRGSGYSVVQTHNSAEMLQYSKTLIPHLMIIDLDLIQPHPAEILNELAVSVPAPLIVFSKEDHAADPTHLDRPYCIEWVTKDIPANFLIRKINALLRNQDQLSIALPPNESNTVSVVISGEAFPSEHYELMIKAPIRLAEDTPVKLRSALFHENALDQCVFKKIHTETESADHFNFNNGMLVVGINSITVQKWRAK